MRIVYTLTGVCNSNCLHCYRKGSLAIARDLSECEKDILVLRNKGYQITLAGAEVLTNEEYLGLYQLVGQDYLLSNGILLAKNSELCNKLISYRINKVHISWHIGFQSIISNIQESIIKKAIENSLKSGLEITVNCVISNRNFLLLEKISKQVLKIGAKKIRLLQLLPVQKELKRYQLTGDQKNAVFEQVKRLRQIYSKEVLDVRLHGNFSPMLAEKSIQSSNEGKFCPAGNNFFTIEINNKVYPCPFLTQPQFQLGFWRDGQIIIENTIPNNGKSCLAEKLLIIN